MSKRSKKTISIVAMLTVLLVSAFCLGTTLQTKSIANAEVADREAILYYDFSNSTIGANVDGYSSVTNLGTKQGANATIFNGTGIRAYDQLVFSQPQHSDEATGRLKGYFELPLASFDGLTNFTVQMDISAVDAGASREPIFAMTQTSLSNTLFGDSNQGILFGDGWIESDTTYMENYFGGEWNTHETATRPFISGTKYVLTFVYDGVNVSFYYGNTLLLQKANSDTTLFNQYDYFRIGGLMMNWTGGLKAEIDNVKLYDYARSTTQIAEDTTALANSISASKYAKVYYDFETANNGVVENLGIGENMDGRIVQTKNDVRIENGKLVIANDTTVADKNNGYFRLPDNLFKGSTDWTIMMDVERLVNNNCQPPMFYFGQVDPTTKTDNELNAINQLQLFLMDDKPYYQATGAGPDNLWTGGNAGVITNPADGQRTIALIYKNGVASLYYYQTYAAGVYPTLVFQTPVAADFYYWDMVFNKIGGYILSWGRSSTDMIIDSFAFFDYAITPNTVMVNYPLNVEYITANLDDTATGMVSTDYKAYDRIGQKVNRTDLIFPENIDYTTVGVKHYVVWRPVDKQPTPIRFTLTTTHKHVDSDNNGVCDSCNEVLEDTAYGINLSLDGTIKANVYMLLTDETLSDANAVMRTEFDGNVTDVKFADAKQVVDGDLTYYVFSCEVPAKLMDSAIKSYLVYGDETVGTEYVYSVAEYADILLNDTTGKYDDAKDLIEATANYGDFSKAFFAGEDIVATDAMNAVTADTLASYEHTINGTLAEGISIYGVNLILESETSIRVYVKVAEGHTIDEYALQVDGIGVTAKENGDYYYIEISDISAKDLDTEFVVTIGDYTLELSALSYAKIVLESGSDVALTKVMQALYLYNQAANAYLG